MEPNDIQQLDETAQRRAELSELLPSSFGEMMVVFNKWMLIPDPGIIKFLCAFYCANRLPGKAIWAFIIGPSGGGKTEILNAFLDLEDIETISMITTNTFLSGMPGPKDVSLLPRLTGKIMLFKDWTTVLSMQKDARAEIMSQLREIWDGAMKKAFGNGKIRVWKGKVSVLAATTQAVDLNQQQYTHLGERFLNYRMVMPDRKEVAMRSLNNDASQEQMQKELRNAVFSFFLSISFKDIEKTASLPEEFKSELVNLANFCTRARSGVIRDTGMKKEVIFVPAAEMPTRITGQLAKIVQGLIIVNKGEFQKDDMEIVYKIALDSIPQTNKMVITELAKADNQTTSEIATALGYPTDPIRQYLENLALLHVCTREKSPGHGDRWTLDPEFTDIIRNYEGVIELTDEEIIERKEAAKPGSTEADIEFNSYQSPEN